MSTRSTTPNPCVPMRLAGACIARASRSHYTYMCPWTWRWASPRCLVCCAPVTGGPTESSCGRGPAPWWAIVRQATTSRSTRQDRPVASSTPIRAPQTRPRAPTGVAAAGHRSHHSHRACRGQPAGSRRARAPAVAAQAFGCMPVCAPATPPYAGFHTGRHYQRTAQVSSGLHCCIGADPRRQIAMHDTV